MKTINQPKGKTMFINYDINAGLSINSYRKAGFTYGVESMADDLNFMGCDMYSLSYTRGQMAFATGYDYQETSAHKNKYN